MLDSLRRFDTDEVAGQRLRIIDFYDRYGEAATKEAFGVDRKLIYVWKRRLREFQGRLEALAPDSTPASVREMPGPSRLTAHRARCATTGPEERRCCPRTEPVTEDAGSRFPTTPLLSARRNT